MAVTTAHSQSNLLDHLFGHCKQKMPWITLMIIILDLSLRHIIIHHLTLTYFPTKPGKLLVNWLGLKSNVYKETFVLLTRLHTAVASSAGNERLFLTLGLVH